MADRNRSQQQNQENVRTQEQPRDNELGQKSFQVGTRRGQTSGSVSFENNERTPPSANEESGQAQPNKVVVHRPTLSRISRPFPTSPLPRQSLGRITVRVNPPKRNGMESVTEDYRIPENHMVFFVVPRDVPRFNFRGIPESAHSRRVSVVGDVFSNWWSRTFMGLQNGDHEIRFAGVAYEGIDDPIGAKTRPDAKGRLTVSVNGIVTIYTRTDVLKAEKAKIGDPLEWVPVGSGQSWRQLGRKFEPCLVRVWRPENYGGVQARPLGNDVTISAEEQKKVDDSIEKIKDIKKNVDVVEDTNKSQEERKKAAEVAEKELKQVESMWPSLSENAKTMLYKGLMGLAAAGAVAGAMYYGANAGDSAAGIEPLVDPSGGGNFSDPFQAAGNFSDPFQAAGNFSDPSQAAGNFTTAVGKYLGNQIFHLTASEARKGAAEAFASLNKNFRDYLNSMASNSSTPTGAHIPTADQIFYATGKTSVVPGTKYAKMLVPIDDKGIRLDRVALDQVGRMSPEYDRLLKVIGMNKDDLDAHPIAEAYLRVSKQMVDVI